MTLSPSAQVEEHLSHVAQLFAQWRHNRTTPCGRIPKPLWAQAIALTQQAAERRFLERQLADLQPPAPAPSSSSSQGEV